MAFALFASITVRGRCGTRYLPYCQHRLKSNLIVFTLQSWLRSPCRPLTVSVLCILRVHERHNLHPVISFIVFRLSFLLLGKETLSNRAPMQCATISVHFICVYSFLFRNPSSGRRPKCKANKNKKLDCIMCFFSLHSILCCVVGFYFGVLSTTYGLYGDGNGHRGDQIEHRVQVGLRIGFISRFQMNVRATPRCVYTESISYGEAIER